MCEVFAMTNEQFNKELETIKIILELTHDTQQAIDYITRIQQAK
jgi:hypothetical protein